LVLHPERLPDLSVGGVLQTLAGRRGFIDGVVVSGGEPTLQQGLLPFLAQLCQLGLTVKLDTNGYRPDVLAECLHQRVVQYVAMDVKSSLPDYARAAGVPIEVERVLESINLLLRSDIEYEFRTTVVPGLVGTGDVEAIVDLIAGARRYYLQSFRPGETISMGATAATKAPSASSMQLLAELASGRVQRVDIRGASSEYRVNACPS
jgi:pyruvate formate lyase activating enzyme